MKRVVVVGSINQDISLRMKTLPIEGDTVIADTVTYNSGGKGANQAVALSRLGSETTFICSVGDDTNGRKLRESLESNDVRVVAQVHEGKQTGFAVIAVDDLGQNNIIVHPGANFLIDYDFIEKQSDLIKGASYCVMQFELPMDVIHKTIELCNRLNVPVVINPAPYNEAFGLEQLRSVDYFIPNYNEFYGLFGEIPAIIDVEDVERKARHLSNEYDVKICVTLGSMGSLYVYGEETHFVEALKVDVVDTTAAGDTFIGAFIGQINEGADIKSAMEFATKASSIAVSAKGAQESIPYLKDLQ